MVDFLAVQLPEGASVQLEELVPHLGASKMTITDSGTNGEIRFSIYFTEDELKSFALDILEFLKLEVTIKEKSDV